MTDFPRNALAICAHPDDAEIFCAGTMKLLAAKGWRLRIVTVTAGGMGGIGSDEATTIAVRRKEAEAAAAELGAEYRCLGGRDGFLYDTVELRLAAQSQIREFRAGVVFAHLPSDYHGDHRAAALVAEAAAMLATLPNVPVRDKPLDVTPLLYHMAPLGLCDLLGDPLPAPHFFVDISTVMDEKMRMLRRHVSQQELMRVMHRMEDFQGEMRKLNASLGAAAGCGYAEAFWQHLGGGFQKDPLVQHELAAHLRTPATKKGTA